MCPDNLGEWLLQHYQPTIPHSEEAFLVISGGGSEGHRAGTHESVK